LLILRILSHLVVCPGVQFMLDRKGKVYYHMGLNTRTKEENDETNIPAQQKKKKKEPWLSGSNENKRRPARNQEQKTEGKKKTCRLMSETFTPRERIRKKKDFLFLYKKGNRYRGRYFNLIYLSNDLNFSRMAVVVSKKVAGAVERNTIKRRLRTLFRRNKHILPSPLELTFLLTWTRAMRDGHQLD